MSTDESLSFRITTEHGRVALAFAGEIDLCTGPRVVELLDDLGATPLEVDLGGVTFLDCSGLGYLEQACAMIRQRGGRVRVRNPSGPVMHLLGALRIDPDQLLGAPAAWGQWRPAPPGAA